jgi:hypothetical protein
MRSWGSSWFLDWRKLLVYAHRWLGIAGCLLFMAWFVSGVVMMYARMPGLANEERLARAPALDLSTVRLSPQKVIDQLGIGPQELQVGMFRSRPVYRFGAGRDQLIVFADTETAEIFEGMNAVEALSVARRYAPGHSGPIQYDRYMTEPDQWTLQARGVMPLHRFALDDAASTHLYVSEVTGDVVLRTTRQERFWGYLGPVLHWVYFTPLRRNGPAWSEFIIWSSVVGCLMCISGLAWGLWRYSPRGRFRLKRVPSQTPYAGLMKWHHYAGLLFGAVTLTWTYSGLLSMGPFGWFATPPMTRDQREASTGGPLQLELLTIESMRGAEASIERSFPVKELEVIQFRGDPFWVAYRAPTEAEARQWMHTGLLPRAQRPRLEHLYVSAARPDSGTFTTFDRNAMMEIARAAMPEVPIEEATWLEKYDGYYYDLRSSRALPVLRVRFADPHRTWLYLDPQRGGIVQRSVSVSRLRRWLYQGLHSLDFPFLYFRRPLWDIVVIALSIGGLVLSATTAVPAWRRLRRHYRAIRWRFLPHNRYTPAAVGSTPRPPGNRPASTHLLATNFAA